MTHHRESRMNRRPAEYWLDQHFDSSRRGQLTGERQILELISLGAPLPSILNKLCTAIDLQIGNVVSLVLLPDRDENHRCSVSRSATQVGLHLFSSTGLYSRDMVFLGTLEIFGCDPRQPTQCECQLIELAVHLAVIALERQKAEENCEKPPSRSRSEIESALERPPYIN
jgi:GAF domain-containing protein